MRHLLISLVVLLLLPALVLPQEGNKRKKGQGYAAFGIGAANAESALMQVAAGGELYFYKGLGMGAEIGYLTSVTELGEGLGLFSANGQYTFDQEGPGTVKPFVTGGYTLVFRCGYENAFNFGGGVHYWFSDRVGLRVELRDHISPDFSDIHFWQARFGLDFR